MKEWYAPSEIRYWPEHIEWIITYLFLLEQGVWPPDPRVTGYTDVHGPARGHSATFEIPVAIAAEVTYRMGQCGPDGKLARRCLADGWDAQELAELMHADQRSIESRVRRVVHYCSGIRRRRVTYIEFKRRGAIRDNYRRVKVHGH